MPQPSSLMQLLRSATRNLVVGLGGVAIVAAAVRCGEAATNCPPTPWDEIGPFYRANAPVRSKIGSGYILSGTVRSSANCKPIAGARIEIWQAGPSGAYDEAHRATILADRNGSYRLETDFPPPYARRPSHIHILVDASGYAGLITQHYPKAGEKSATLDLVLEPE